MARKKQLRWEPAKPVAINVRTALPRLMDRYFDSGRKLTTSKPSANSLHRFRLKTKRVRYTLELFLEHYGPGLDRRLNKLKDIQTLLGDINDCATTLELLNDKALAGAAHRDSAAKYLEKRTRKKTNEFLKCWGEQFDAPGEGRRWRNYLSRATKAS